MHGETMKIFFYSYSKLMNLHRRIHGDERPFLCDNCGKGFKNRKQLRNHKVQRWACSCEMSCLVVWYVGTTILEETEKEGAAGSCEVLVPVYQSTWFHIP
jgi:hypothetical protein